MAKLSLTSEQEQHLSAMVKSGARSSGIKEHFKTKHGVDIPNWKISYVKTKAAPGPGKKRAYSKRKPKEEISAGIEEMVREIVSLISEIDTGYKAVIKYIRQELIKSRNQVHEMVKNAGIEDDGGLN